MPISLSDPEVKQKLALGFAGCSRNAGRVLLGTTIAVILGQEGASPLIIAMSTGVYFFTKGIFSPVWGAIADTTGRRRAVLIASSVLATLSIVPLFLFQSFWSLIAVRGLYGAFIAGFLPSILTIVSEKGGAKRRGRWIGFFNSSRKAGGGIGRVTAGFILGLLAPQGAYLIVLIISIISTLGALLIIDPTPTFRSFPKSCELLKEIRRRIFPPKEERKHFDKHGLKWLYVALGLRHSTVRGIFSLIPVYLIQHVGTSEFAMGILLSLNGFCSILFMYMSGKWVDIFGRKPLIIIGMTGSALFGIILAAAIIPGSLIVRMVVVGISQVVIASSFSAMNTGAIAFIGDVSPLDHESELQGFRYTAGGIASMIGPIMVGVIATFSSYEISFIAISLLTFVGVLLTKWKITESRPSIEN